MGHETENYDESMTYFCGDVLARYPGSFAEFDLRAMGADFKAELLRVCEECDSRMDFSGAIVACMKACLIAVAWDLPENAVTDLLKERGEKAIRHLTDDDKKAIHVGSLTDFDPIFVPSKAMLCASVVLMTRDAEVVETYMRKKFWSDSGAVVILGSLVASWSEGLLAYIATDKISSAEMLARSETAISMRRRYLGVEDMMVSFGVYESFPPNGISGVGFMVIPTVIVDFLYAINYLGMKITADQINELFGLMQARDDDEDLSDMREILSADALKFLRNINDQI